MIPSSWTPGSASSRRRRLLFGAELGKAILEVFSEQKKAFEVEGEDRKGMTTAKETFRGGMLVILMFSWGRGL